MALYKYTCWFRSVVGVVVINDRTECEHTERRWSRRSRSRHGRCWAVCVDWTILRTCCTTSPSLLLLRRALLRLLLWHQVTHPAPEHRSHNLAANCSHGEQLVKYYIRILVIFTYPPIYGVPTSDWQMWTDFRRSFTSWFVRKFYM